MIMNSFIIATGLFLVLSACKSTSNHNGDSSEAGRDQVGQLTNWSKTHKTYQCGDDEKMYRMPNEEFEKKFNTLCPGYDITFDRVVCTEPKTNEELTADYEHRACAYKDANPGSCRAINSVREGNDFLCGGKPKALRYRVTFKYHRKDTTYGIPVDRTAP
jgi:hypothetical protein